MTKRERSRGFTLIEVSIAIAIGSLLFLAIGAISQASGTSMDYLGRTHRVDRDLRMTLETMCEDIKRASVAGMLLDTSDTDHDMVAIQVPDPNTPGAPVWGYFATDGVFQPGWRGQYMVIGDDLVLRRLNFFGGVQGNPRILCQNVDVAFDPGTGTEKGFTIVRNGSLVTIGLRVHETFSDGRDYRRAEQTTVNVSNP